MDAASAQVVVLPSVPVTPMTRSLREGKSCQAALKYASAERALGTRMIGNWRLEIGDSVTMAIAPRAMASGIKRAPSTFTPGYATNNAPGVTWRESAVIWAISMSRAFWTWYAGSARSR